MVLKFFEELFYVLSGAFLVLSLMEFIWDRVVLSYININWVLIAWLITGIIVLIITKNENG